MAPSRHSFIKGQEMNLFKRLKSNLSFRYGLYKRIKHDKLSLPLSKLAGLLDGPKQHRLQILLLGDSVSERTSNTDTDTTPLSEMIGKKLGSDASYYAITHSAYYADIYLLYLALLLELGIRPGSIIVPLNVRCTSPQWDFNPMYQCGSHLKQLFSELHKKVGGRFDNYKPQIRSVSAFMNSSVRYPEVDFTRIAQFQEVISSIPQSDAAKSERKRIILTYHYMNRVEKGHRKLKALSELAALCREQSIRLLVYMTPINFEAGEKYVGKQFTKNLKANALVISEAVSESAGNNDHIIFRDYSTALQGSHFFHPDEMTEHLNQLGRDALSNHILAAGVL